MHQSIPAVNILPGDPRRFADLFCLSPGFSPESLSGEGGAEFGSGQILPEIDQIYSVFLFLAMFSGDY